MRCPECAERNSVAARKCEFCGTKFKKKPLPLGLKLACGGVAVAVTASIAASYLVPHLADPQQNLARVAKRIAAGPKVEEVTKVKKEFSTAIKDYLKTAGDDKVATLTASLQKLLPSSAFEVHIVDLPRGLRVVEVDTVLQANAFLVMNTSAGTKVFDLPGFEVFDDARILNDSAGPVLALLGHTGGQLPHKPILRTYALLPDYINDESEKLVPPLKVDGTARFAANGNDVHLEFTTSSSVSNKKSRTATTEKLAYGMLKWKDARYVADFGATAASVAAKQVKLANNATPVPVIASVPVVPTAPAVVPPTTRPTTAPNTIPTPVTTVAPAQKIVVRSFTAADQARSGLRTAVSANGTSVPTSTTTGAGTVAASNAVKQAANTLVTSDSVLAAVPSAVPAINNIRSTYKSIAESVSSSSKHRERKTAEVICSGATLRAQPARGAAAMNSFGRGTQVTVLGKEADWYHVRVNGQEGYIYSSLLNVGGSTTSSAAPAVSAAPPAVVSPRRRRHTEVAVIADATPERKSTRHRRREKQQVAASEPILVP